MKVLPFILLSMCLAGSTAFADGEWDNNEPYFYEVMPKNMRQAYVLGMIEGFKGGLEYGYDVRSLSNKEADFHRMKRRGIISARRLMILLDWCVLEKNAKNVPKANIAWEAGGNESLNEMKQNLLRQQPYYEKRIKEAEKMLKKEQQKNSAK